MDQGRRRKGTGKQVRNKEHTRKNEGINGRIKEIKKLGKAEKEGRLRSAVGVAVTARSEDTRRKIKAYLKYDRITSYVGRMSR